MADETIRIEYIGETASAGAFRLHEMLVEDKLSVAAPVNSTPRDGELGLAEMLITIVATGLAKAAARVAVRHIRAFLRERIEMADKNLRVRVAIPRPGGPSRNFPFPLAKATLEMADELCGQIEKAIESA